MQFPMIQAPWGDTTGLLAFNGKTQLYYVFGIDCPILNKVTDVKWH